MKVYSFSVISMIFIVISIGSVETCKKQSTLNQKPILNQKSTLNQSAFLPYDCSIFDEDFENALNFPKAIRDACQAKTIANEGKSNWRNGEGMRDSIYHPILSNIEQGKAITPVFDFLNYHNIQVFGQFFQQTIGYVGVIRGWYGNFYVVHPAFRDVFLSKFTCYGLPSNDYVVKRCDICRSTYVYQDFSPYRDSIKIIRLYNRWIEGCTESSNGNHDNVRTTPRPPLCEASDNIYINDTNTKKD